MAGTFLAPNFQRWERCVVGVLGGPRRISNGLTVASAPTEADEA